MMHGWKEGGTEGGTDALMHEQIFGALGVALSKKMRTEKKNKNIVSLQ